MTSQEGAAAPSPGQPLWNLANIITVVRVLLVPLFAVLMVQDSTALKLAGAAVFLLAALTDKLDGYIARSRNLVTNFGKLADPIADKALVLTALILLSAQALVPWWVTIVIILRELGITLLRFIMVRRSVIAASSGGKLKTVLQIVFITGFLVPWDGLGSAVLADVMITASWVVMVLGLAVTVLTGLDYIVRAWRISRRSQGTQP